MRRALPWLAIALVLVVVVIGLTQALGNSTKQEHPKFDLPAAQKALAGAPAPLNGVYAQANQLLGGGRDAFDARIAALKAAGTPIVINKWASWCIPCQGEFGVFENAAVKNGTHVAFIGLNSDDKNPSAEKFLAKRPLPFPSYTDPGNQIATNRKIAVGFPMTLMINRQGKTFIHTGPYSSVAQLSKDIARYAS
jgi:cytochrome c biogenesis protein CcmG/thiol:disulfide interchange protein DsbE